MRKVKEFIREYKEEIRNAAFCSVGFAFGWAIGRHYMKRNVNTGLGLCCLMHPEMKDMIEDSTTKLKELIG